LLDSQWWEIDFPQLLRNGIVPPLDCPLDMLKYLELTDDLPKIYSNNKRKLSKTDNQWVINMSE